MTTNLTTLTSTLTAGDTINYRALVAGYSAASGWILKLRLLPRTAGGAAVILTGSPDGLGWLIQALPAESAVWEPGPYGWAAWLEKAGERYTIEQGQVTVLPDPATAAAGTDTRTLPRRTYEQLLEARASWAASNGRVRRYKIGDREREFASAAELDREIAFWERQLVAEETAARLAAGIRPRNRILTRFSRTR